MDEIRKALLQNCKNLITQKINSSKKDVVEEIEEKKNDGQETQQIMIEEKNSEPTEEREKKREVSHLGELFAEKDLDFLAMQIVKNTNQSQNNQSVIRTEIKTKVNDANKSNPIVLDDDEPTPMDDKPQLTPPATTSLDPQVPQVDTSLLPKDKKLKEVQSIASDESDDSTLKTIDVREIITKLKLDEPGQLKLWTVEENIEFLEIRKKSVVHSKPQKQKIFFKVKKSNSNNIQRPLISQKAEKTIKKLSILKNNPDVPPYQSAFAEDQLDQTFKSNKFAKKGSKDKSQKVKNNTIKSSLGNLINRKSSEPAQSINLTPKSMKYLVEQCMDKHLINRQLYDWFQTHFSTENVKDFIKKFQEKTINATMFGTTKISIIDHRRMSELLVRLYPSQYKIMPVVEPKTRIDIFLKNLYDLDKQNYKNLCQTIDAESKVKWWKQVQHNLIKNKFKNGIQKGQRTPHEYNNKAWIRKSTPSVPRKQRGPFKGNTNRNYEVSSSELSEEQVEDLRQLGKKKMIR